jgi:hypothetical protein
MYYYNGDNKYELKKIKAKDFNQGDYKLSKNIINHALGSIYSLNAQSADCYAFTIDTLGEKYLDGTTCQKPDFSGGWDWSERLVDTSAQYLFMLSTKKFYKICDL